MCDRENDDAFRIGIRLHPGTVRQVLNANASETSSPHRLSIGPRTLAGDSLHCLKFDALERACDLVLYAQYVGDRVHTRTDSSRWISWTIVILLHGVFVLVLQQMRMSRRSEQSAYSPSMIWVRVTRTQLPRTSGRALPDPKVAMSLPLPKAVTEPKFSAMPPTAAPAHVNWALQGAISASAAASAASTARYRSMGPRKAEPQPEPSDPPLFEEPERRAGQVDGDMHGDPIVWVNEHCYQELEKPVPTARDVTRLPKQNIQLPTCVAPVGKSEPRGDLFDHIRKQREKNLPPVYPPARKQDKSR